MRKIAQFYFYRNALVFPYNENGIKGWTTESDDNIYKTLDDVCNSIDKRLAGEWYPLRRDASRPKRCDKPIVVLGKVEIEI